MAHSSKKKAAVKKAVSGKADGKTTAASRNTSVQKKAVTRKKTAAPKAVNKKVTGKTAKPVRAGIPSISISPEERWKMIAIAAYHKAEARGFVPGGELQDWLKAEEEIDILITR